MSQVTGAIKFVLGLETHRLAKTSLLGTSKRESHFFGGAWVLLYCSQPAPDYTYMQLVVLRFS